MSNQVFEEAPQPQAGAVDKVRKQARQLAYDIRYKVKGRFKEGQKGDPGSIKRAYMQELGKSSAAGPVKQLAKKMLIGEEYDMVELKDTLKSSINSAMNKVFVEGYQKEEVEEEVEVVEEESGEKFVVRITDTNGQVTYRKADNAKIAELRKKPNVRSIEKTDQRNAKKGYDNLGKDYDGDGKVESGSKEHAGVVHNAIQRKKGGNPDGQDTRKEEIEVSESDHSREMRKLAAKERSAERKEKGANAAKSPGRLGKSAGTSYADYQQVSMKAYDKATKKTKPSVLGMTHEEYVDEGLRSAVKRLLGKKDAPAEKKPESRGEQLRKKYNVGPEKSDTSAKKQILDRTRAKAERDKKQYGGSVYTKSVADKSKAAHDRYLKGGYSKYGADDARGKGNKARRRAEALKKEDFNWLVDTLISEGYNLSSYTVDQFYDFCEEVIYEKEEKSGKKLDVLKKGDNSSVIKINPKLGEQAEPEKDGELSPEDRVQLANKKRFMNQKHQMQKKQLNLQKQGKLPMQQEEKCEKCDGDHNTKDHEKKVDTPDRRAVATMVNLVKNKMRARGLNMSYDMEGNSIDENSKKTPYGAKADKAVASVRDQLAKYSDEKLKKIRSQNKKPAPIGVKEAAEDRLRDQRQERGGVDGNTRYDRPPARKRTNAELGIKPGKTMAQKEMEKKYGKGATAMDVVRAQIRAKHGKGSMK